MPGNVRELENLLHRSVALGDLDQIPSTTTPPPAVADPTQIEDDIPGDLQAYLDTHERAILLRTLQETNFNRTAAASRLGLSLRQIRYRIARLGIAPALSDDNPDDDATNTKL